MHTYILTDETVAAYLRELLQRIVSMGSDAPITWVTIGASGDKLMAALLEVAPDEFRNAVDVRRLRFDRSTGRVLFPDTEDRDRVLPSRIVLIDGPVHSGATMNAVCRHLHDLHVEEIVSYGLAVKRSSEFIPNFFGLMVGEHDRVYFQLNQIPNHRLQTKPPFGVLRAISAKDTQALQQSIDTGGTSLDDVTLSDLWYGRQSRGDYSYIYELKGKFSGFIHFFQEQPDRIFIDGIANSVESRGRGIGGLLMRWAENWARNHRCVAIDLYAIEDQREFYESFGYEKIQGPALSLRGGSRGTETYYKMSKRILYNIDPNLRTHA